MQIEDFKNGRIRAKPPSWERGLQSAEALQTEIFRLPVTMVASGRFCGVNARSGAALECACQNPESVWLSATEATLVFRSLAPFLEVGPVKV